MAGSPDTELLAVDGVMPSYASIRDATYPYVTKVYAVIRRETPEDAGAARLRDWLRSAEGRAVIRESGYVPLRTTAAD